MTLANFKSNFNWQYRMLKEAAECCGIVPDLPPGPPPPVVDCYWYTRVHDDNCIAFSPSITDWTINGVIAFGGWELIMQNAPYGTTGNAIQYTDPLSGCGSFASSDYHFWTVVPASVTSLPDLTGNDSNGNPVSFSMVGPICDRKCYEGSFRSPFGSTNVIGLTTTELNAPEFSIFVDLTSPTANTDLATQIGLFYPSPPLTTTVTVDGPDQYTIRIDGLYSIGAQVYLYMDDFATTVTLNEIPC